jgi:hypothetical protein
MSKLRLKRPVPGTILGFIALMVALAGNADALTSHTIVRKGDIAKGAVTAKALAPGAVKSKALAKGSVNSKALAAGAVGAGALGSGAVTVKSLAPGSVTSGALGANSVTSTALAPSSIYGGALGSVVVHGAPIADLDVAPENGTWTPSSPAVAMCAPGERLLDGGIVFTKPGNGEVGVLAAVPTINGSAEGYVGRITSNSGGTAAAEVQAVCLK